MCKLCDNYNFGHVGFDFDAGEDRPTIYFPGSLGIPPEKERFKFCPMCGNAITPEHFKNPPERKLILYYMGRDSWSRPVYEGPDGVLYVDTDPREDREPDIFTKQYNAFDGEPNYPVYREVVFIPKRDTW